MSALIDIGPATLEDIRPDLVVVRFKGGSVANAAAFQVSMGARKAHFGKTPHAVVVISPDDADFDPSVLRKDHYLGQGTQTFTLALAFVSRDPTIRNILELYYTIHPAPFPVGCFSNEHEAFPWVEGQLAQRTT